MEGDEEDEDDEGIYTEFDSFGSFGIVDTTIDCHEHERIRVNNRL